MLESVQSVSSPGRILQQYRFTHGHGQRSRGLHIDYAGPLEGKMFLLISDTHSKWLDIHQTNSSTTLATIELLRRSFATLGLPETVVSDSSEFAEFLSKNGIRHIRTPPYHPASNGLVERAVQAFKEGMKRIKEGS